MARSSRDVPRIGRLAARIATVGGALSMAFVISASMAEAGVGDRTDAATPTAGGSSARGIQIAQAQGAKPTGTGKVNSIDAGRRVVNLSHGPVAALGWPAMTMNFPVAQSVNLASVKEGGQVTFTLGKGENGKYAIDSLRPAP
jgi:Cu/Ag efflux protein CusF